MAVTDRHLSTQGRRLVKGTKVFLTLSAMCMLGACTGQAPSGMSLLAIPLPAEGFAPYGLLPAAQVGEMLLMSNSLAPRGSGTLKTAVAMRLVECNDCFTAERVASLDLMLDTFPRCLLPDGTIVSSDAALSKKARLWSHSRAGAEDITPANIADTYSVVSKPHHSLVFCDARSNLYISVGEFQELGDLWVGRKRLKQVQMADNVLCRATVLRDGELHYAVMDADFTLHVLDQDSLNFERDEDLRWFGQALQTDPAVGGRTFRKLLVTPRIGAHAFRDEIRTYSKAGEKQVFRKFSPVDVTPSGFPRAPQNAQRIINDPMFLRREASRVDLDQASTKTSVIIVSEDTLALVDLDYCRIVLVKARNSD